MQKEEESDLRAAREQFDVRLTLLWEKPHKETTFKIKLNHLLPLQQSTSFITRSMNKRQRAEAAKIIAKTNSSSDKPEETSIPSSRRQTTQRTKSLKSPKRAFLHQLKDQLAGNDKPGPNLHTDVTMPNTACLQQRFDQPPFTQIIC